jgi:hypothetical protein
MVATPPTIGEERIVLPDVSWQFYELMLRELGETALFVSPTIVEYWN